MVVSSIFKSTNRSKIQIGLIVGFNSKKRYNNYGFIIFTLNKSILNKPIDKICKIVDYYIKKNQDIAIGTYIVTNIYDKYNDINRNVDILFSGLSINNPTINNVKLEGVQIINPNPNIPMYCSYVGFDNTLSLSISINTPNVDKDTFAKEIFTITKKIK